MTPRPVLLMSHALGAGGGERQLAYTALRLRRYRAHVAAVEGGHWADALRQAGVPLFWVQSRSLMSLRVVREGWRLSRYLRHNQICLAHSYDYTMNLFGIPVAAWTPGVAALAAQRCEMQLVPARYQKLTRWAHRMSRRIVANSDQLRRELEQEYGELPGKVAVCPNGIDTSVFEDGPRRPVAETAGASLVVGTICVLRPEKNIELLIRAFARAHQPGWRLLIVGSGPERVRLGEAAARARAATGADIVFAPAVSQVDGYLRAIDIFVLPSRSEGLSNSLMEAMACGCAVAATAVGGNPELVNSGQTGWLFGDNDEPALADTLMRLADGAARQRLAEAGARFAREEFSLERMVNRIEDLYDSVLT